MNYKVIFPLLILALMGLFFLGDGITGWVTSQSCCFPPNCDPENVCSKEEVGFNNLNIQGIYLGGIMVLLAVAGYIIMHKRK